MPDPILNDDQRTKVSTLIAQGYDQEEIKRHLNTGSTEERGALDETQRSKVQTMIAQGHSQEDIKATLNEDNAAEASRRKEIAPPDFFEYIKDEDKGIALEAYKAEGKAGVIKYFSQKAEIDEAYEAELDKIPWLGGFGGFDQEDKKNIVDGWDNLQLTLDQAYPNLQLTSSRLARSMFGEDTINNFADEEDDYFSQQSQQDALDSIHVLKAQHKDTGQIVEGFKEGDIAGAISGIIASPLNLASTMINTVKTGGLGLFSDMFSETYLAVNEIRAEKLGVTVDELISTGQDSVAAPAAFTSVMTALEFAGLKGVGSYILKSTGKKGVKRLTNWFMANNKEGMTELAQYGLGEAANTWETSGGDVAATGDAFLKAVGTQEALENYATGFFSGGISSPIIKPAVQAIKKAAIGTRTNRTELDETVDKIADLEDVLRSEPSLTPESRERITNSIKILKEEGKALVEQPYRALVNLREDDISKIEEANEQVTAAKQEVEAIKADEALDDAAKDIQLEAVYKKIEENENYTRAVINESNQRITVQNESVVEGIKKADKLVKQQEKINEKELGLKNKEAKLAAAPNPNPTGTKEIAQERAKIAKEQKQLDLDQKAVPDASKEALASADNVDLAVESTQQKQAAATEARQRNPIDSINKRHAAIEGSEVGEPSVQLTNNRGVKTAREDLEASVIGENIGTPTGPNTYETTSERGANQIAKEANQRGLRSTVSKAKGGNYVTTIANPALPGKVTISPTSQISATDPYVTKVIDRLQKFFGTALDIEIRPVEAGTAFGKVTEENGRVKIIISDGSILKGNVKLDTLFHEPGHVLYQLFENSTDPKAKKIFKRIEELIGKTDEYKEAKSQKAYAELSPKALKQEAFAKYFGRYAADKTYGVNSLNNVLNQLVEYVKSKFGANIDAKKLSLNDISDILIADLQLGKPTFFEISDTSVLKAFRAAKQDAFLDTFESDVKTLKTKITKYDTQIETAEEGRAKNKLIQERNDLRTEVAVSESIIDAHNSKQTFKTPLEFNLTPAAKPVGVESKATREAERVKTAADAIFFHNLVDSIKDTITNVVADNAKYAKRLSKEDNTSTDITKSLATGLLGGRKDTISFKEGAIKYDEDGKEIDVPVFLGSYTNISNAIADELVINFPEGASLRERNLTRVHVGGTVLAAAIKEGIVKITNVKGKKGKTYSFVEVVDQEKLSSFVIGASLVKANRQSVSVLQSSPVIMTGWVNEETGMTAVGRRTAFLEDAFSEVDGNGNLVQQHSLDVLNAMNKTGFTKNNYTIGVAQHMLGLHEQRLTKEGKIVKDNGVSVLGEETVALLDQFLYGKKAAKLSSAGKSTIYRKMKTSVNNFITHGDKPFYHVHQYAFMGRIFVKTANGSYQSTKEELSFQDHAKPKPITSKGWEKLLVTAADLFGQTADDTKNEQGWFHERVEFSAKNLSKWSDVAANPFTSENMKYWMDAKEPLLFLMTIKDITAAIHHPGGPLGYPSKIQLHWDATNSGPMTQVLMLRDALGAKFVNLVGFEKLQDLYKKLAGSKGLEKKIEKGDVTEPALKKMRKHAAQLKNFDEVINSDATNHALRKKTKEKLKAYKEKHKDEIDAAILTYYNQPQVKKAIRNYVKPTSMIKFYTAGVDVMAMTLVDKHGLVEGLDDINFTFGQWFARAVNSEVKDTMPNELALMDEWSAIAKERALNRVGAGAIETELKDYVKEAPFGQAMSELFSDPATLSAILPIIEANKTTTPTGKITIELGKGKFFKQVQEVLPDLPYEVSNWARKNFATVEGLKESPKEITSKVDTALEKLDDFDSRIGELDLPRKARNERADFIETNQEAVNKAAQETLRQGANLKAIRGAFDYHSVKWKVVNNQIVDKHGVAVEQIALWDKLSKVNLSKREGDKRKLALPNTYITWLFNNPKKFMALKPNRKDLSADVQATNETLKGHDTNISEVSHGLPTTFSNSYTGFPVRVEPRKPISEQAEIRIDSKKTIKPQIVVDEGRINQKKAGSSLPPLATQGGDSSVPAIVSDSGLPFSNIHDSFGFTAEDSHAGVKAIQDGLVKLYDKPTESAPLRKMFNEMTESDALGKESFDRVWKGDFDLKGNVDNNQHNHSAGRGSNTLSEFQDTFIDDLNAKKANELFNDSKGQVFTESDLDTVKSEQAGALKESWFKGLTGISDLAGRLIRSFVPPQADDYHGLIQRIAKNNQALKDFLRKEVTDKYVKGWHKFVDTSNDIHKEFDKKVDALKKAKLRMEKAAPTPLGGVNINNQQAIIASIATDAALREYGATVAEVKALRSYIASNKELGSLAQFLSNKDIITSATELDLTTDIGVALNGHINTGLFNDVMADFLNARENIFNKATINTLRAKFGDKFVSALDNSLDAMARKNQYSPTNADTTALNGWLLGSVGVVMFINVRSAILQMLSVINYATASNSPGRFFANFGKPSTFAKAKELFSGAYLSERRRNAGFDVNANELFAILEESGFRASVKFILKKGFFFTSVADSFAVALGGAAFIQAEVAAGSTEAQALSAWKEQTEEAQQSSRPDRVSTWQRSPVAKFILAFANTPQQYFRLTQKAIRTFKDSTSTASDKRKAAANIGMYLVLQNAIFTVAQGALASIFKDDDEGEEQREKAADSMLNSVLRGMGFYGAGLSTILTTLKALDKEIDKEKAGKQADYTKAFLKLSSLFPPVNKKISQLQKMGTALKYDRDKTGAHSIEATIASQSSALLFNLPLDWVQKKAQAVGELNSEQFAAWEKVLLLAGWSTYDFPGGKFKKKDKKSKGRKDRSNRRLRSQRKDNR